MKEDRISRYLVKYLDDFAFTELSPTYLESAGLSDLLTGVSLPLKRENVTSLASDGADMGQVAGNMVRVIGVDPQFEFAGAYVKCIERVFGEKAVSLIDEGAVSLANNKDFTEACIYFRAALAIDANDLDAMYGYIRVLGDLYNSSKEKDYVGNFKAECLEYLERIVDLYPNFPPGWYYLGFMYLNLGLYTKAQLAWERFVIEATDEFYAKEKNEVAKRMKQIATPLEIEKGYNAVLAGRWDDGILILEKYVEGEYSSWWPLWYYLGVAYMNTLRIEDAKTSFKTALKGNPRHIETLLALIDIYDETGDEEMVRKYSDKLDLVRYDMDVNMKMEEDDE